MPSSFSEQIIEADSTPHHHLDVRLWSPDDESGYGTPPQGFTPDPGADWVTYTVQFPHPMEATGDAFELITAPEAALRTSDALLGLLARAGRGDAVYVEQLYEHLAWPELPAGPNPTIFP